ncbi:MAG TPA: HEAT repeat domain-containing protein [Spirochaetota bacterium]|nr:HEAT repeat domain-containing protein [Spirochaetota bacterium]HPV40460.1 HEAT repeat domain-containing protein [Spirochaetota bacterium]
MWLFSPNVERMKKKNDMAGLLRCLQHKSPSVRYRAFLVLAGEKTINGDIINHLKKMLNDPDERVRTAATLKFAALGAPLLSKNLVELISGGSRKEKISLLKIITGRGRDVDGPILEAVVLALEDRNGIVKLHAVEAAGATGSGRLVPRIAEYLNDRHSDMRIKVAQALCSIGNDASMDHLIGLLADTDAGVRSAARACLENVDLPRVRMALHDTRCARLIRGMGGLVPDRIETAKQIGVEGIREGLPLLHRACRDRYKGVRLEAARSLAAFGDRSSVEALSRLLDDKFYDVRIEAVRALGRIAGQASIDALQPALEDKNKRVRGEARRAISDIKAMVE